jgi:ribosomal protein S18 acetylase RimI-like enzyme
VRGRGVGKALLEQVMAIADGPLSLKVQAPNLRAQAFYRREGFLCTEHGCDPGSDVGWLRLVRET